MGVNGKGAEDPGMLEVVAASPSWGSTLFSQKASSLFSSPHLLISLLLRASPTQALKFGVVKVVCSVLELDTARSTDASFIRGSILQRNQEDKNNPSLEAVK
jgi:hypothetical protein